MIKTIYKMVVNMAAGAGGQNDDQDRLEEKPKNKRSC